MAGLEFANNVSTTLTPRKEGTARFRKDQKGIDRARPRTQALDGTLPEIWFSVQGHCKCHGNKYYRNEP